jgi:hypothetical protein
VPDAAGSRDAVTNPTSAPLGEILVAQQQALLEESGPSAEDIEEFAALGESVFRAIADRC